MVLAQTLSCVNTMLSKKSLSKREYRAASFLKSSGETKFAMIFIVTPLSEQQSLVWMWLCELAVTFGTV
jgi:hypothetical protein